MRYFSMRAGLALAMMLAVAAPLRAQSASEILKEAADRYSEAFDQIDNMKMVIRPEGAFAAFETMTTYYEKVEENGTSRFRSKSTFAGGMADMMNDAAAQAAPPDMMSMNAMMYEKLAEHATYTGREDMDGFDTFVLQVDDLTPLMEEMNGGPAAGGEAAYRDAMLYIDADEYVLRRMKFTLEAEPQPGAGKRRMGMEMNMSDYKKVGPMFYPHRMVMVMDNPMTTEERAEMQAQRMQIEAMLDQVPEGQRESLRKMLDAMGGNEITTIMVTDSVDVNKGVPAGTFD